MRAGGADGVHRAGDEHGVVTAGPVDSGVTGGRDGRHHHDDVGAGGPGGARQVRRRHGPGRLGRAAHHQLEAVDLGSRGRLWSWTVQGFCPKPPYDGTTNEADFRPYGVGYVELADGIKVESRLTLADPARLRIGMAMELTLEPYRRPPQGEPVFTFAFGPAQPAAAGTAKEALA